MSDIPLQVGIIGYGYWGPNLARNVVANSRTELAAVSDLNPRRLEAARASHPRTLTSEYRDVIADSAIDAVFVATPPETHFDIVMRAIDAGKHVLVEKPFATTSVEARTMVDAAAKANVSVCIDHTFLFTGAVRKIKELFVAGEVGDLFYFDSTRINLGLFQTNTNVIWDLAPHDIAMLLYLVDKPVKFVSAVGARHVDTRNENIAYITIQFEEGLLAHLHVNWLAPTKVRRTIIGGSKKMLVYDDVEADEKLKVYDSGVEIVESVEEVYGRWFVEYRTGDVWIPRLDKTEALAFEVDHLVDVFHGEAEPISGGELGVRVVELIEAAERSLRNDGTPVRLA